MKKEDRRHLNPGRPPVAAPRVRLSCLVSKETLDGIRAMAEPRKWGRLIDRWAEIHTRRK